MNIIDFGYVNKLLTGIWNFLVTFNSPMVRLGALLSIGLSIFTEVKNLWSSLFTRIDSLAVVATGNADFTPLSFLNYIFPFEELLTITAAWLSLYVLCAAIRIIKSFIPTIAT